MVRSAKEVPIEETQSHFLLNSHQRTTWADSHWTAPWYSILHIYIYIIFNVLFQCDIYIYIWLYRYTHDDMDDTYWISAANVYDIFHFEKNNIWWTATGVEDSPGFSISGDLSGHGAWGIPQRWVTIWQSIINLLVMDVSCHQKIIPRPHGFWKSKTSKLILHEIVCVIQRSWNQFLEGVSFLSKNLDLDNLGKDQ